MRGNSFAPLPESRAPVTVSRGRLSPPLLVIGGERRLCRQGNFVGSVHTNPPEHGIRQRATRTTDSVRFAVQFARLAVSDCGDEYAGRSSDSRGSWPPGNPDG